MALNLKANPEQIATVIRDGIAATLEENIKVKLMEVVDPIVSELARDLAKKTSVHVQSMLAPPGPNDPFGPTLHIRLAFNNKEVQYEAERSDQGGHAGRCGGGCKSCTPPAV